MARQRGVRTDTKSRLHHALQAASTARRRSPVDNALRLDGQALQLSSGERERISALTALGDGCQAGFRGDDGRHHYQEALRIARGNAALAPERARLCAKLVYRMAMVPGSFRVSPDPIEVDRLVEEGLAAAGGDEASRARLLVAKGGPPGCGKAANRSGKEPGPIRHRSANESPRSTPRWRSARGEDWMASLHLPPRRSASSTGPQGATVMRLPSRSGASREPRPAPGKSSWTPSGPQRY